MSFFQTVTLFFVLAGFAGFVSDRVAGSESDAKARTTTHIYSLIGIAFVVLIIWTILQFLFNFPAIQYIFPMEAALVGVICALGIKGGYAVLQERHAMKKNAKKPPLE